MKQDIFKGKDIETINPAKRAKIGLDVAFEESDDAESVVVLDESLRDKRSSYVEEVTALEAQSELEEELRVPAKEERTAEPILEQVSERRDARILIITKDVKVFDAESLAHKRVLELADSFDEVHVLLLALVKGKQRTPKRVSQNAWIYPTNSKYWFMTMWDAQKVSKEQLTFGDGFRPDIILADDPFESGVAGYFIANRNNRPFQVHVSEDFFNSAFKQRDENNGLRISMANFCLKRADCVRTRTEYLRDIIIKKYKRVAEHVEVLPTYHNLNAWRDAVPTFNLSERHPQFKFFIVHVTSMDENSHTDIVIEGLASVLKQSPAAGLIIVGDGPHKKNFEKRVSQLQLQGHVIFEPELDALSCIKTAHVLLYTSENSEDEYLILQAAVCEIPIISGEFGLAPELFVDGESALLCTLDTPRCLGEKVNRLLNENQLRKLISLRAQDIVFARIEQDYSAYLKLYRDSVERCFVPRS